MRVETLTSECWHLEVLPDLGASVLNLLGRTTGEARLPVLRTVHPATIKTSSQAASYVLAPWSNRIRQARFEFDGQVRQLRPNNKEGTAIHGDARNRAWQVTRLGDSALLAEFDARHVNDLNFPWTYTVRAEYRLDGPHFETRLTLTNVSEVAIPAGMGLHPYFTRFGSDGTDPTLRFAAGGVYRVPDPAVPIPDAGAVPLGKELDFHAGRAIGGQFLDHVFSGWDGQVRLDWGRRALSVQAEPAYSHLVVFTAPDRSLAIEPVTHATDGFNLMAHGVPGTGVQILQPGQSLSGAVRLSLEGEW